MGVVLSYPVLAAADLAAGRLVAPFELSVPLDFAFYVVYADATEGMPEVVAFKEWLLTEAAADASPPARAV
jgi:LysR family glycine cleavage system transcriptional activator